MLKQTVDRGSSGSRPLKAPLLLPISPSPRPQPPQCFGKQKPTLDLSATSHSSSVCVWVTKTLPCLSQDTQHLPHPSHPHKNKCPDLTPWSRAENTRGSGRGFPVVPRVGIGDGMAGPRPHGECVDGASIVGGAVGRPGMGEQERGRLIFAAS